MSFVDKITSIAMDVMKDSLSLGDGALGALPIDVVEKNAQDYLNNTVNQIVYGCAVNDEQLYSFLVEVINDPTKYPEPIPGAGVVGTGFLQRQDAVDIKDAMDAVVISANPTLSIQAMYDPLTRYVGDDAFVKMGTHVDDVKTNLPDIIKVSGTANAMRGATVYDPVEAGAAVPDNCSTNGVVIADITTGTPPPTVSALEEVAGTASSQGDVLQANIFACTDELVDSINIAADGDANDPSFSQSLGIDLGSIYDKASNEFWQTVPGWVADAITDDLDPVVEFIGFWALADKDAIIAAQDCAQITSEILDNKIDAERQASGLPGINAAGEYWDVSIGSIDAAVSGTVDYTSVPVGAEGELITVDHDIGASGSPPIITVDVVETPGVPYSSFKITVTGKEDVTTGAEIVDAIANDAAASALVTAVDNNFKGGITGGTPVTLTGGTEGDPHVINLQKSTMVAEIKQNTFAASVTSFDGDSCAQSIATRAGVPSVATVGGTVTASVQPPPTPQQVADKIAVDAMADEKKQAGETSIQQRKDALITLITNEAIWTSSAYSLSLQQLQGMSQPIDLDFNYTLNNVAEGSSTTGVVSHRIETSELLSIAAAGENDDASLLPAPDNTQGKTLLSGVMDEFTKNVGFSDANSASQVKIWVWRDSVSGNHQLVWAPIQNTTFTIDFFITAGITDDFVAGFYGRYAPAFISEYIETFATDAEIDEFERSILPNITLTP